MEQAGGFLLMCFLPERHTAKKMHLTVQFRFHFKCSMDMACPASLVILLSVLFLIFKQFIRPIDSRPHITYDCYLCLVLRNPNLREYHFLRTGQGQGQSHFFCGSALKWLTSHRLVDQYSNDYYLDQGATLTLRSQCKHFFLDIPG